MDQAERFSQALEQLRAGVYIVTSAYRNQPAGCTCVWVSRASFNPPLVSVCLAANRHTMQTIERGKRLCINVIGDGGIELARKFGFTSGHDEKKFAGVGFKRGLSGSPILDQAVAYIDCKLHSITPLGDHFLVAGELVDAATLSNESPLVYDPVWFYKDDHAEHTLGLADN